MHNETGRGDGRGTLVIHCSSSRPTFGEIMQGDGNFKSDECRKYTERCDIVVSNPPSGTFSSMVAQCNEFGKNFIIFGGENPNGFVTNLPIKIGKMSNRSEKPKPNSKPVNMKSQPTAWDMFDNE